MWRWEDRHSSWRQPIRSASSSGTGWHCRDEEPTGTIEVGRDADLALLGADLRDVSVGELAEVPVAGTWLAGQRVHGVAEAQ